MVPGGTVPINWPTLNDGLKKAQKRYRNRVKRQAEEIESAFHEAAHAVITNAVGGDFAMLEIHRTKRERADNDDAWGSISIRIEQDPWGDALASLAGPLAAQRLSGILRRGSDYWDASRSLQTVGKSLDEAEKVAEALIDEHWFDIERVASLLMITDFGKPNCYGYAYWNLRRHLHGGTAEVSTTLREIPDSVKKVWETERGVTTAKHSETASLSRDVIFT